MRTLFIQTTTKYRAQKLCPFTPAMIEEHVCYANIFFVLVEESENGMIDRETFMRNCI